MRRKIKNIVIKYAVVFLSLKLVLVFVGKNIAIRLDCNVVYKI